MTKKLGGYLAILLALLCCFCFVLAACGSSDDSKDDASKDDGKVDENTDTGDDEGEGEEGEYTPDPTVYYTVTFDMNYDGSTPVTVSVEEGTTVSAVSAERDGYMFLGWYTTSDCTTEYDFTTAITKDTTIYAGWMDEAEAENYITITYMWNFTYDDVSGSYTGVFSTQSKEKNANGAARFTSFLQPSIEGYYFKNWYTDESCSSDSLQTAGLIYENTTLYALWYKGFSFEAENTDMTDEEGDMRQFNGYSQNGAPIKTESGCSGGMYVGDLYMCEEYIEFEIISDKAVSDAEIFLCLAMGSGFANLSKNNIVTIEDTMYSVTVNGTKVTFDPWTFDISGFDDAAQSAHSPFSLYQLEPISLKAGTNLIRLETSYEWNGQGGSQNAVAPLIDYMTIYSNTELSMNIYSL